MPNYTKLEAVWQRREETKGADGGQAVPDSIGQVAEGDGGREGENWSRVVEPRRRIRKITRNSLNSYRCYNNIRSRKYGLIFTVFQVLQPIWSNWMYWSPWQRLKTLIVVINNRFTTFINWRIVVWF